MALETDTYDTAEFLDTEEGIAAYLAEVFASGDPAFIADGIGVVARARGDDSNCERRRFVAGKPIPCAVAQG